MNHKFSKIKRKKENKKNLALPPPATLRSLPPAATLPSARRRPPCCPPPPSHLLPTALPSARHRPPLRLLMRPPLPRLMACRRTPSPAAANHYPPLPTVHHEEGREGEEKIEERGGPREVASERAGNGKRSGSRRVVDRGEE